MEVFYSLYKSYGVNRFLGGLSIASPFYKIYILAFPFIVLNIVNSFNKVLVGTTVGGVLVSIDFFSSFYFYRWNLMDLLSSLSSRGQPN